MVHPALVCGGGVLAISMGSILIVHAQRESVSPLTIAAWRLGVATLVLLPVAWARGRDELRALRRSDLGWAGFAGMLLAVHFVTWIESFELTTQTSAVVLVSTVPVWVAIAAPFVLRERTGGGVALGVGFSILGAIVITLASHSDDATAAPDPVLGNGLAVVGAWGYAGYLLAGRGLRARLSLLSYVTLTYGAAAVCVLLTAVVAAEGLAPPTVRGAVWCVALALVPQLAGHSMLAWALRRMPAATVSVIALGEPVGAIILAVPLLGVVPGPWALVGAAVVLAGIWWVGRASAGERDS